jgi:hypothetical protein
MSVAMQKRIRGDKFIIHLSLDIDKLYSEFEFLKNVCANENHVEKTVTFLDESKNNHKGSISFSQVGQNCYWDRNPFEGSGIGCPINKVYKPSVSSYKSAINGMSYVIQDTINVGEASYDIIDRFCSPECCLASIESNSHDPMYMNSKYLLFEMLGKSCVQAPSWRLLKEYGGPYTIEEFRRAHCNRLFTLEGIICKPMFFVYKESYHLT